MPKLRKVSGEKVVRILCNKMGFEISGRTGSHVTPHMESYPEDPEATEHRTAS